MPANRFKDVPVRLQGLLRGRRVLTCHADLGGERCSDCHNRRQPRSASGLATAVLIHRRALPKFMLAAMLRAQPAHRPVFKRL